MPSWKKVILSGSNAALNSLTVINGITGSLFGTASFATSASYAPSAGLTGGAANYIPLWTSTSAISSSVLYQSASNVGIGTTTPFSRFTTLGALSTSTSQISIVNSEGGHIILRTGISGLTNSGFSLISADVAGTNQNTRLVVSSTGNVGIGTTSPNARLDVSGSAIISGSFTVTPGTVREFQVRTTGVDIGNLITDTHTVTGSLSVSGSVNILSSTLQYSNNAAILSGSTANIASFATSSYMAGFFDFVASSGLNARAGTVFTVWNGASLEFTETSTNDIGTTTNLALSASLSGANVLLQGTSLSGSWNVKTLTRML